MSLIKQLWIGIIVLLLLVLGGNFVISTITAKTYLQEQLRLKNIDNAKSNSSYLSGVIGLEEVYSNIEQISNNLMTFEQEIEELKKGINVWANVFKETDEKISSDIKKTFNGWS